MFSDPYINGIGGAPTPMHGLSDIRGVSQTKHWVVEQCQWQRVLRVKRFLSQQGSLPMAKRHRTVRPCHLFYTDVCWTTRTASTRITTTTKVGNRSV